MIGGDIASRGASDHDHALFVVEEVDEFVVLVRKYTAHPGNIFRESVIQWCVGVYNAFLMTDQAAVEHAERDGTIRLPHTDMENPF